MSLVALHSVVPAFTLPDLCDQPVSLWEYKHRRPVVLIACEPHEASLLRDFAQHYERYRAVGAEVLGIVPSPPDDALPFPVLVDAERDVLARLTQTLPAVLVLDSYHELYVRRLGPWRSGPDHDDLLAWIHLTDVQCPECGVPEWPLEDIPKGIDDAQRSGNR